MVDAVATLAVAAGVVVVPAPLHPTVPAALTPVAAVAAQVAPAQVAAADSEGPHAPFFGPSPRWPVAVDSPGAMRLNRDCGFTAPLRDGRVLWIFCDTAGVTATGDAIWPWLDNTAALATVDAPTRTDDVTDGTGRPNQFVEVDSNPCPADRPLHRVWPLSATTVPDGAKDQVYVYFEHACGVPGQGIGSVVSMGMGLARWTYTSGVTSVHAPVRATVLAQGLFDGAWDGVGVPTDGGFGRAVAYDPADGNLYLYRCHSVWGVANWGCEVARVPVAAAADRGSYRFRTATGSWQPEASTAAPMQIAGTTPGSGYQVAWYPQLGRWALVGMTWPGIGSTVTFRVADQPWGPWSAPTEVSLPEESCRTVHCYAVYGHPGLDRPGSLSFTFYDPVVAQVQFLRLALRDHRFWDVPPAHPFHGAIEDLGGLGVIHGYQDGSFGPTAGITRQAIAAMLYRSAGSPWGTDPRCSVPPALDVETSNPFCGAIRWLLAEGIASGYADGSFGPGEPVSRQAVAAFLYRMAVDDPLPDVCPGTSFSDVGAEHTFCEPIRWLVGARVAYGYPDGTFGPTAVVSRQAFAAFLHRLPADPSGSPP